MEFKEILQLNLNTICRLSGFRLVNPFFSSPDLSFGESRSFPRSCLGSWRWPPGWPVPGPRRDRWVPRRSESSLSAKQFSGKCVEEYLS